MKILLASGSPRRIELLNEAGFSVRVHPSGANENFEKNLTPETVAKMLSLRKAQTVCELAEEDEYTVAADTSVVIEGRILGKPKDEKDAFEMLKSLSGKEHFVYTGIAVVYGKKAVTAVDRTKVIFNDLTDELIKKYIATGEPMDKAGAYGIQHYGPVLVKGIEGDYFNVMGLPLHTLFDVLNSEYGVKPLSWIN